MSARTRAPRVLMLSDVYFSRVNGVSTSIETFRRDIADLGGRVWLVAPDYARPWDDDEYTIRVPSRAVPFDPEDRLMSPRALLKAARPLAGEIDLIHVQTPFVAHWAGLRLANRWKVKVVETYHTYFEQYFHHYAPFLPKASLGWAARNLSRAQCNAVDAVISPSEPMAQVLRDYGVQTPIEVIGTGLDLARFGHGDGDRFRRRHGIPPKRPLLLHVGRVAFEKNIDFIVDVFEDVQKRIPDALLVIAGEGPALRSLRSRVSAKKLDEHVLFVGYLDRAGALIDCYRSADAFVFASNTETQGLVILEAMAVGVPVVSTSVLGTKDILGKGKPGALVVPESRDEFTAAIVRVLTDRVLSQALTSAGPEFVRSHWSSLAMARRTMDLYSQLSGRGACQDGGTADRGIAEATVVHRCIQHTAGSINGADQGACAGHAQPTRVGSQRIDRL